MKLLYSKISRPFVIIAVVALLSTIILWLPFIFKAQSIHGIQTSGTSFQTVLKHWDGPLYIIPAKSLYNMKSDVLKNSPLGLSPTYFAAHLPLYPLTIRLLAPLTGYPKATVVSTVLASIGLFWFFYFFTKNLKLSQNPLALTLVFMFFTPRFFLTRSVGSPEPLFMLLILASLYFFVGKKYFLAGLAGALAAMTKTPAMILFGAYALYFTAEYMRNKKINYTWLSILLIPAGLFLVFLLYHIQYGDFLAYFHSGDNIHLLFPPYQIFNYQKAWVGTGWLEEVALVYLFYAYTVVHLFPSKELVRDSVGGLFSRIVVNVISLIKNVHVSRDITDIQKIFFYFSLLFFMAIISVQHRDISRYSLPMLPIALITFEKFFTSKRFLIALAILLPGFFLYAWNMMLWNVAPITDWSPFL